jgi:hypothetical protein
MTWKRNSGRDLDSANEIRKVWNAGSASHTKLFTLVGIAAIVALGAIYFSAPALRASETFEAAEVVTALGRPKSSTDALDPQRIPESPAPLDLDSIRRMGVNDTATHWVATNEAGDVCLVVMLTHKTESDWAAGLTCEQPAMVREFGLWLRVELLGQAVDTTLVADGLIDEESRVQIEDHQGTVLAENLVVFEDGNRPLDLIIDTELGPLILGTRDHQTQPGDGQAGEQP